MLVDIEQLLAAYFDLQPDPGVAAQRVAFGTSGHRGSSLASSFNQWHVLAISQAICDYRNAQGIDGPLFIGADSHALSQPALDTALQVLAANGVQTMISAGGEFTPTPAISHAILVHNRGRSTGLADGIVITPSHNPPDSGGFKYNPCNGGPADSDITNWVQNRANALLEDGLKEVKRMPLAQARQAASTHAHDYLEAYVGDLGSVIDFAVIRAAGLRMGVDPLGGAGVHYWSRIAEQYGLDLQVVSQVIDPQFAFMSLDWDGQIRMDPSSSHAMQRLIGLKDGYDIAFACDTDYDRHGIVAPSVGLLPANHFLSVAIDYLFQHRPQWSASAAVGKTLVSSAMIDRVSARLGRPLLEVPVGFKWFAGGLFDGSLGFAGHAAAEESPQPALAGAGAQHPVGRRQDHPGARQGAGQRRGAWRDQGGQRRWLVRRAAIGHRGHLQDLCRELPRPGPPAADSRRGAADRRCGADGGLSQASASTATGS